MINTTLCYIEKDSCYLMIHRTKKQNDCNKDKWIGVGGKFEEGECPEECVTREVKEETGLILNTMEYRGIVTFVSTDSTGKTPAYYEFMHLFWSNDFSVADSNGNYSTCKSKDFALPECSEGDLEWVPKAKMNELPHWKGDEIFLDLLDKKVPFFSLKLVYEDGELVEVINGGKKVSV